MVNIGKPTNQSTDQPTNQPTNQPAMINPWHHAHPACSSSNKAITECHCIALRHAETTTAMVSLRFTKEMKDSHEWKNKLVI